MTEATVVLFRLHFSLQYFTSSQFFSHFFLQVNNLLQVIQAFCGRNDLFPLCDINRFKEVTSGGSDCLELENTFYKPILFPDKKQFFVFIKIDLSCFLIKNGHDLVLPDGGLRMFELLLRDRSGVGGQ